MPFRHTDKGWYWGSKGPFATRAKAQQVATAAHASGFKEENEMEKKAVGEFVGVLLHSATITHFMHLRTTSYAAHVALGAYYDAIVELTDSVAEAWQGCYGELIEDYPNVFSNTSSDPLEYLITLKEYVENNRSQVSDESNIQNEIDAILTLLDSTLYKLRFLK